MEGVDFGILRPLMEDATVNEIMVNGFDKIFIERRGKLEKTKLSFGSAKSLLQFVAAIAKSKGVELTSERPYLDSHLPDGSRLNIVVPPMAVDSPALTFRRFSPQIYQLKDLVALGTLSDRCAYFLNLCVKARANIIISGGTSSGKTTFLNALVDVIPRDERIVTIEDTPELRIANPNWVRLEAVHTMRGDGISVRDCLVNALRMRPDRIIVGECRKNETFEMLQAMNTGHSGSLTTIHANTARDCLSRIESLVLSHADFPLPALRKQIVSALDIIVQLRRDKSGERIVTDVLELTGTEGDMITAQNIFALDAMEHAVPSGLSPKFAAEILECGLKIPDGFFDPKAQFRVKS